QQAGTINQWHVVSMQTEIELRLAWCRQVEIAGQTHFAASHAARELADRPATSGEQDRGLYVPDRSEDRQRSRGGSGDLQLAIEFSTRNHLEIDTQQSLG